MKIALAVIFACFLSSVYAVLYGPELEAELLTLENNCLYKTIGLNSISLRQLNEVKRNRPLPSDGSFDKFAICILQKYHVFNADGTLNEDVDEYYLISDDPEKKAKGAKCKTYTGNSNEETARKILQCFLNTDVYMINPKVRVLQRVLRPYPRV